MTSRDERLREDATRDGIQKLVVGAIVHDRGRVLVVRRSGTDFMGGIEELPSGGVERGEDLLAALGRELREEIGRRGCLRVDDGFVSTFDYVSGSGHKARQFTFAVAHDCRSVRLSGEHSEYRWLAPADLGGSDVTDETAATIREWAAAGRS
jgi:8-oxo-dGTP diphosphatase